MNKQMLHRYGGKNAGVGELLVNRLLPGLEALSAGPFFLLDHLYPTAFSACEPQCYNGRQAHPHRGIATFSYVLSGALEHVDSAGNYGIIGAGEAQWLNAGNGILHNESPAPDFRRSGGLLHCLQFWINLPAAAKSGQPEYHLLRASAIPEAELPELAGSIRILIGSCGSLDSPVRTFHGEFIYHLKLNPKSGYSLNTKSGIEYALFVPSAEVRINGEPAGNSELLIPASGTAAIVFDNPGIMPADVIIFGGKPYDEPIFAQGPFVMNSPEEVAEAYKDFFEGVYGEISVSK
ncbi:pirin family protein [Mucilaginibacter sp. UR6-1]|uniref:pirin family protein n=1 Tax=Mucilaginibacter sp. UR6-1 TaxID=1435643 RepID=UPI001E51B2C4|nr:pirin family protein [Mucilaginibacter sp. UR6-1]MCC8407758.1 pirin family protein [Mucilaginibacter sp. UR6-1]